MLQNKIIKAVTGCIPVMLPLPPPHARTMQDGPLPDIQECVQVPTWSQ